MDKVYDMCDYILENMRTDDGPNNVNRYVAAGFISRFMLYEGTWQKYHAGEDYCDAEHAKKYLEMAVRAASLVMDSNKYNFDNSFKSLFVSEDLAGNSEVLLYRHYDNGLEIRHPIGSYCAGSESSTGVNLSFIKSFLCQDGKPWSISTVSGAGDFSLANLVLTRDPRFFDCFYGAVNKKSNTMIYCYKFASYEAIHHYMTTGGDQLPEWKGIYNTNDCPIMRLGEIVLNWIEAKAELAQSYGGPAITQDDLDRSINAIRNRPLSADAAAAGVQKTAALQIGSVPVDPKKDADVPALIWEIRRERRMEMLHEGNRIKDLLRWYKLDYMDYDMDPDKYLGPWVNFPVEEPQFMNDRLNVLCVQHADGTVVKYNGTNASEMVGFYCIRNASNRETFFDRSYMAPVGQNQIDEYKMRGYKLTQTENW
jgi:hypothetical protein